MNALAPLSWLYGAGVALERGRRSVPGLGDADRPRVVSIGNLEAGGNGKTPLAMWWLARALATGGRAACVSRGYGGAMLPGVVTCVLPGDVAAADASGLRVLARSHPDLAAMVGDEGALVAERVPGAIALFCADKRRAVHAAVRMGADLVVLDDGFQSWGVARHTDVVLLDADAPLDGGHLLPAGRLREKPDALRRADVVVFNGADTRAALDAARDRVAHW
ncbi:MAG TPA: tetraacyldisaccharide 4'-kinase, partial [Candidatus Krumholzibacteria bacterium]